MSSRSSFIKSWEVSPIWSSWVLPLTKMFVAWFGATNIILYFFISQPHGCLFKQAEVDMPRRWMSLAVGRIQVWDMVDRNQQGHLAPRVLKGLMPLLTATFMSRMRPRKPEIFTDWMNRLEFFKSHIALKIWNKAYTSSLILWLRVVSNQSFLFQSPCCLPTEYRLSPRTLPHLRSPLVSHIAEEALPLKNRRTQNLFS
jgi:hypothetical protein